MVVTETVYAYRVSDTDGNEDSAIVTDIYDPVTLQVGEHYFESDARHIEGWAEKNGLHYEYGSDDVTVEVQSPFVRHVQANVRGKG